MTLDETLTWILKSDTALKALFPGGTVKVFPLVAPDGTADPYLTYQCIGGNPIMTQDSSNTGLQCYVYMLKAYSAGSATDSGRRIARKIAVAAKNALCNWRQPAGVQACLPVGAPVELPFIATERMYQCVHDVEVMADIE